MAHFNIRPGTKSATHILKKPVGSIAEFDTIVRSLIQKNPLGCTAYRTFRRFRPA